MASDSKKHTKRSRMPRARTLQHIALVLLVLGVLSLLFRVQKLPSTMVAAREREALEAQTQQIAKAAMRGAADAVAATTEEPVATVTEAPTAAPLVVPEPTSPAPVEPTPKHSKTLAELNALSACERERDSALLDVIRASQTTLCASPTPGDSTVSGEDRTTAVTLIDVPGGIKATVFTGLELNLAGVKVHKPIKDLSQDGGSHDPRFVFTHNIVHCRCADLVAFAKQQAGQPLGIWATTLAGVDPKRDAASTLCDPLLPPVEPAAASDSNVVVFHERVILIARRDDHNPFFQVANALNAYIVAQALGWDLTTTRVVHLDSGYASPVDALHERLLSPSHALVHGDALVGKRVQFRSDVLLAPWEVSGPMMQHLNDDEPCRASQLFQDFRHLALTTMGALTAKSVPVVDTEGDDDNDDEVTESSLSGAAASVVTVTVITRRPYKGRKVQRVWRNEDDVLERMRAEYTDLRVEFQSVDFVDLTLREQMDIVVQSDIVIGMHGAGMVNVFWTRPETLVVEIFPRERRRWGYRNLCQFLRCDWHEFRGGKDIGKHKEPNSKDKTIPYGEWRAFFDPLLRAKYALVQEQANDLSE